MKKEKVMRTIAFVSGVVFTSAITIPTAVSATINSGDALMEYIDMVLPAYLNGEISESSEISISNSFNLIDDNQTECEPNIYFVFDNDSIVGTLTIGSYEGQYYSSFEKNDGVSDLFVQAQSCYNNGTEIALTNANDEFTIQTEDAFELTSIQENSTFNCSAIEKETTVVMPSSSSSVLYHIQLNTTRVANSSYKGAGLCWAATMATKYNYLKNSNMVTSYIAYVLDTKYGSTPSGTSTWILRGYNYLFGDGIVKRYMGMMDYNEIIAQLQKNNPIHMSLTGDATHGVLLSGINVYNGYSVYYIDDSNSSTTDHVAVYVSSDTMYATSDFIYYATEETTYTTWRWSYY